ncbi:hypothetical protein Ahy_A01g000270 isoform B [Arachis hypogaea]|uniref:Uncharacterized protein n=1 Tax=Arachis hypogaea TaxID=3818 RepID=A0A445EJQ2_ARAHY|nr:hypothetical protein Ahy_A01g000270 isoform B [Arachis hypogaea]
MASLPVIFFRIHAHKWHMLHIFAHLVTFPISGRVNGRAKTIVSKLKLFLMCRNVLIRAYVDIWRWQEVSTDQFY